jgi:hypothetical protein
MIFWNELCVLEAFWQYQVHPIPILYEEDIRICSKWAFADFFVFF